MEGVERNQWVVVQGLRPELFDPRRRPAGHAASGGTMTTGWWARWLTL